MELLQRRSMQLPPCPELEEFKKGLGTETFRDMQKFVQNYRAGLLDPKKVPIPACFDCNLETGNIHMCLQCIYLGCRKSSHLKTHFEKTGHVLALDIITDEIYCAKCNNYVFDATLAAIVSQERQNAHLYRTAVEAHEPTVYQVQQWQPTPQELEIIMTKSRPVRIPSHLLGLRGLNNLGSTCFMNVILQSFVHNPLLRGFFLSDRHNKSFCELTKQKKHCLPCEMDTLFDSMYSGVHAPFSPHHFLYTTWKCSDHLAGYDQQDAHEFFIASIDRIHSHCVDIHKIRHAAPPPPHQDGSQQNGTASSRVIDLTAPKKDPDAMDVDTPAYPPPPQMSGDSNCTCIIHKSFSGLLRSDVVCQSCKKGSTAYDPFFDISLDIASDTTLSNGGGPDSPVTLADCLRKFTQPESLENFRCQNCNLVSTSTKQLSMNKLPVVICFHLKRFKQLSMISSHSTKIDTYVEFPQTLDMAPFMSAAMVAEGAPRHVPPQQYELFCVVNHHGKIDNGHYTCFVRQSADMWYKCDDHLITKASAGEVARSRGYLLFYVRQNLSMDTEALKF